MRRIRELVGILLVSSFIGMCVGLPFIFLEGSDLLRGLVISSSTGIIIGISATLAFIFVFRNVNKKTLISFLLVFIIIGLGTFLGPFLTGLRNILYIVIMVILAEIFGMIATIIIFRKTRILNKSLVGTQEKYRSNV